MVRKGKHQQRKNLNKQLKNIDYFFEGEYADMKENRNNRSSSEQNEIGINTLERFIKQHIIFQKQRNVYDSFKSELLKLDFANVLRF
jgi:hypothetical protein